MGEIKAELIITGGRLVNVCSGEILEGMEISVLDGRICYVGPSAGHTRGDATEIFAARGLYENRQTSLFNLPAGLMIRGLQEWSPPSPVSFLAKQGKINPRWPTAGGSR